MKTRVSISLGVVFLFWAVGFAPEARAHREDYINETFVYRTLDKGEVELEFFSDIRGPGHRWVGGPRWIPGFEWGVTERFMVDAALTFQGGTGRNALQRVRTELRYRFSEEGRHFVDRAVSLEYEWEREDGTSEILQELTPRLVLNRDFREKLNLTLNLEARLRLKGSPAFAPGYRVGVRYPDVGRFRYGAELQEVFAGRPEMLVVPQLWFSPRKGVNLRVGYAKRLTNAGPNDYVRLGIEAEF